MTLKRGYYFTDIHFGRKSNSPTHNQDCLNYIEWFCQQFREDPDADYIAFLGDWHESRTAIDISTLNYSYKGAQMLNNLGVPVYFIVGNHDMGMRHSREIYSTVPFHEFDNFIIIHDEPTFRPELKDGALFVPYLTKDEYPKLNQYTNLPLWAGHFEFKDFVLTGYSITLKEGPDVNDFKDVGTILSGHFHRRQIKNNTIYIGNAFPMDFGDANDVKRGLAVYDHNTRETQFINWDSCPRYLKCTLGDILDGNVKLSDDMHIDINIDTSITYQQLTTLEEQLRKQYNVRSINLDETSKFIEENADRIEDEDDGGETVSTNDLIINMLSEADEKKFNRSLLIDLYRKA